jgi:biopolymer transport protein ExbD|tara:strand:+ start:128 stop:532 length:405 start_codon:yes stop_codon:yes gene_type:complete
MKIPKRSFEASVPSMAMGDIAFLLLIFFVILARAQDDSHLRWEPASEEELEQAKNYKASVVIDVDSKSYLNGRPIAQGQLAGALTDLLGNAEQNKRTVLLKVHKDATAIHFEPVIEAVSKAGGEIHHVLERQRK